MPQQLENARGATYVLPRGLRVSGLDRPAALTIARGGLGAEVLRRDLSPARGALEGSLTGATYAEAQAKLDALLAFLHWQPLKYRRANPTDPYLEVWTEGLDDSDTLVAKAAVVRVPLVAPDPLRVGGPQGYPGGGAYVDVTTGPVAFPLTNVGNAPAPLDLIVTPQAGGPVHMPKLENLTTGHVAEYIAALPEDWVLTVKGGSHDAIVTTDTSEEVGVADLMGARFLVGGLYLAPGENNLRFTGDNAKFRLAYTARYY